MDIAHSVTDRPSQSDNRWAFSPAYSYLKIADRNAKLVFNFGPSQQAIFFRKRHPASPHSFFSSSILRCSELVSAHKNKNWLSRIKIADE
jgi:hypothetical protein